MEMLIKENEKFSKMLKKAIATGAVAVIVGGGAMVPVYASIGTAKYEDRSPVELTFGAWEGTEDWDGLTGAEIDFALPITMATHNYKR